MSKFKIEEIMEDFHGKHIFVIGNSPSVARVEEGEDGKPFAHVTSFERVAKQEDTRIITVNGGVHYHPYSDAMFSMDDMLFYESDAFEHPNKEWYLDKYKTCPVPIITSHIRKGWEHLVEFPLRECLKEFNVVYFTETIDYIIAFAIMCKAKTLELHGCDYQDGLRRPYERCGTEFWLGIAHANGVELRISDKSQLLRCPPVSDYFQPQVYGYCAADFPLDMKVVADEINRGEHQ